MGIIPIALATQSSPERFPVAGAARLINCFMEPSGAESKTPSPVWGSAGYTSYATVPGNGGIRCLFEADGQLIVVAGTTVSIVYPGGTSKAIGGLATTGPVYAAKNRRQPGAQVALVSTGQYAVVSGGTVSQVSDPALAAPNSVDFLDGYFLFSTDGGKIQRSEIDNATLFDGLAFAVAESNPGPLLRLVTHERRFVAFKSRSIEFWTSDASVDPFAFSRVAAIELGCAAAGSIARVQQTLIWIADDKTVRRLQGFAGTRISSYSVDRFIAGIADLTQVSAFTYTLGGNTFYVLNAPNGTWEYNLITGLWNERVSYGLNRWRVSAAAEFDGGIIVGDYASPKLYRMSNAASSEAGTELVMTVQTPPVHAFPYNAQFSRVDVDVIPGGEADIAAISGAPIGSPIGLLLSLTYAYGPISFTVTESATKSLMLDWSDDGGVTFSSQRILSMGDVANGRTRVKALRCGRTRSLGRTFRMSISRAAARGILQMGADVVKLGS